MSEQKIQVGDKVRISYEGVVTDVNKYNEPMIDGGQYFYTDASRPLGEKYTAGKVEILEKRKPQVGDVIASRKGLKKLPELTVVVGSGTPPQRPMIVTRNGTIAVSDGTGDPWVTEKFHKINGTSAPYAVIYVPSA